MCTIKDYKCSIYRPQIMNEKSSKLVTIINEKTSIVVGVVEKWILKVMDIYINNLFITHTLRCQLNKNMLH